MSGIGEFILWMRLSQLEEEVDHPEIWCSEDAEESLIFLIERFNSDFNCNPDLYMKAEELLDKVQKNKKKKTNLRIILIHKKLAWTKHLNYLQPKDQHENNLKLIKFQIFFN